MSALLHSSIRYIVLLILSIHLTGSALSQQVLFEKEIELKRGFKERREAYPVINPLDQNLSLFLIDNKTITGNLFNKDFQLTDTLEGARPAGSFKDLLGSNTSGGKYNLFFAQNSHTTFTVVSFDFANRKVSEQLIALPVKKEKYAGCASYLGKFYLFTAVKASSILKLYVFRDHTNYTFYTFDFKDKRFGAGYVTLSDLLQLNPLTFIDNEVPNAIELAAKKNKLYGSENKLVITLDNQSGRTAFITIDLATFESDLDFYDQPRSACEYVKSNSYFYKNHLYQFVVCPSEMIFSVGSLKDNKITNEFRVNKDEEIYFKNSAVVLEVSGYNSDRERELSKTRQFLRKVSALEIGAAAYETSAGIEIILGGYQELQGGSGGGGMMMGTGTMSTPGGPISVPVYNPTFNGYNAYKFTKSVYFKSLLDASTFDHRDGVMPRNVFDKIQTYTKTLDESITAETLFRKDNACVLGYYFKPLRHYVMRRFVD